MKKPLFALAASAVVVAFAVQVSLPPALSGHTTRLKSAQSLKAKLLVNEVGGASVIIEVSYSKPNMLRIDSPARLVVCDGQFISVLDKSKNSYTQTPFDGAAALAESTQPGVWGWASFLEADPAKLFKTAKSGVARKLRGVDVTEVEIVLPDGKSTATMYIETKTGIARGFQYNADGKQFVVWAESVEASAIASAPTAFSFVAPAGATKVDPAAVADVDWAKASAIFNARCMPCHSAALRSGTLDLSTYQSVSTHRFVVKGEANNSVLARALRASGRGRMPQGQPPLPEGQIKSIEAWINGGLKQ